MRFAHEVEDGGQDEASGSDDKVKHSFHFPFCIKYIRKRPRFPFGRFILDLICDSRQSMIEQDCNFYIFVPNGINFKIICLTNQLIEKFRFPYS